MGEAINLVEYFKVEKVIFNCGEYNDLEKELINVLDKKKIPYYSCIKELNIDNLKTHSENLVPLIDELFKTTNRKVSELDLIACDVGPRFFYRNTYWNCYNKGNCRSNPNTSNILHFFRGSKLQYKFKHNMLFNRC